MAKRKHEVIGCWPDRISVILDVSGTSVEDCRKREKLEAQRPARWPPARRSEPELGQREWTERECQLLTSPERGGAGYIFSLPSALNKKECLCHTSHRGSRLRGHPEIPQHSELRVPKWELWPEPAVCSRATEQGSTQQSSLSKVSSRCLCARPASCLSFNSPQFCSTARAYRSIAAPFHPPLLLKARKLF